jgi:hypothetical protein
MSASYASAEDRVYQDDFKAVLKVLGGPSRWRQYISPNLEVARANNRNDVFQIVDSKKFTEVMRALGESGDVDQTPGVTDKKEGRIYLQEFFGINSRATFLGAALHETVHLISHPVGGGPRGQSTAWAYLGQGLLEGLVEVVTEDILRAQQITWASEKKRGHKERARVMRYLIEKESVPVYSVPFFAKVLFGGQGQHLVDIMEVYTPAGWQQIKQLTTANNDAAAIRKMTELRKDSGIIPCS